MWWVRAGQAARLGARDLVVEKVVLPETLSMMMPRRWGCRCRVRVLRICHHGYVELGMWNNVQRLKGRLRAGQNPDR